MTLTTLLIRIAIAAVILTLITYFGFKKQKSLFMSYLQNFCGALFIFSGYVKVVDSLGTAYKMEQYFGEFETHFTWFAPLFPILADYALHFSVIMIVFEIALGVMLIIGSTPKLTSWLFFGLCAFFTVLTGFTYLTGHLANDATFFEFGKWGPWVETNMKVTDCGCFGDFIKLKPFTTFMKDVCLMFPAVYFLFQNSKMHRLFSSGIRTVLSWLTVAAMTVYSFSNFYWDIPGQDFRPFKNGVDINAQKLAEEEASTNAEVSYVITNKADASKQVNLSMNDYMKEYKKYPKAEWDIDQQRAEPAIPTTKISEFEVSNVDGDDVTDDILNDPNYSLMFVAYKLYYDSKYETVTYADTTWAYDTIDTVVNPRVVSVDKKTDQKEIYLWDKDYQKRYQSVINPLAAAAEKAGMKAYVITKFAEASMLDEFRHATQTPYPFYTADDILLKTIVRSNPGILLMKNGKIIKKWHYKKVPSFAEMKAEYIK